MSLAGQGFDEKAIRLQGAVKAEHEAQNSIATIKFWLALQDRYVAAAEKRLGPEATQKERQIGRSMGFEAAIDYALASEV